MKQLRIKLENDTLEALAAKSAGQISDSEGKGGEPKWTAHRIIVYTNLSDVADVHFIQKSGEQI
jgi:hypothetical protein